MSGFSAEWLALREPFDHAARSMALMEGFVAALRRDTVDRPVTIMDLGAGTGSALRSLAPLIDGDQQWILVDDTLGDEALSALATWAADHDWTTATSDGTQIIARPEGRIFVRLFSADLADLAALPLDETDGVVTSALLDLVSAEWISSLGIRICAAQLPFLAQLSVDGRTEFTPTHPADALVHKAFAEDQNRDKGFGPGLGAGAVEETQKCLRSLGYHVSSAQSDWSIAATDSAFMDALLDGLCQPASANPLTAADAETWLLERRKLVEARRLTTVIGHVDILALPQR